MLTLQYHHVGNQGLHMSSVSSRTQPSEHSTDVSSKQERVDHVIFRKEDRAKAGAGEAELGWTWAKEATFLFELR